MVETRQIKLMIFNHEVHEDHEERKITSCAS